MIQGVERNNGEGRLWTGGGMDDGQCGEILTQVERGRGYFLVYMNEEEVNESGWGMRMYKREERRSSQERGSESERVRERVGRTGLKLEKGNEGKKRRERKEKKEKRVGKEKREDEVV
jgi:hypothetical protein